jgi:hypothetical protein
MNIDYAPHNTNTFIFSFVRMNPPTPGHLELIKTMIYKGIELNVDRAYIITSSSLDGKNPIPCNNYSIPKAKNKSDAVVINKMSRLEVSYKSTILDKLISSYKNQLADSEMDPQKKEKIQNFYIDILCSMGNPFGFIYTIIKNNYIDKGIPKINMFFVVGRDRAYFLDTIVDNFRTKEYVKSIDGTILERTGMESLKNSGVGTRKIEDINSTEFSGSFIRNLVKNNQRESFGEVYSLYLEPEDIQMLYDTIKIGLQMKEPSSKEEDENPQSRYFDGMLLPIINPAGGKRRRRKTKKKNARKNNRKFTKRRKL